MALFVRDYSDPAASRDAIPLIVIHGLFGSGDNWQTIAKEFGLERPCYSIDLPSHGESEGGGSLRYDNIARELSETIQSLGIDSCYVMGHSMGGKSAMALALLRPELVKSLVVVDIAPRTYSAHHEDVFAGLDAVDPMAIERRSQADEVMTRHVLDPMMRGFLLKNLRPRDGGGYAWRFDLENICKEYAHILEWPEEWLPVPQKDGTGLLYEGPVYTGPVWFVAGAESDFIVTERDGGAIKALFPQSEVVTVANARHWVHADNKTGFMAQVKPLLL